MYSLDWSNWTNPSPVDRKLEVGFGGEFKFGLGTGGEGLKGNINVTGVKVQGSYDLTNHTRNFTYDIESGFAPGVDINPVSASVPLQIVFQRYTSTRGNTVITGYRAGTRDGFDVGVKLGLGVGAGVKGGVQSRDLDDIQFTFKNGSYERLSAWDKLVFHSLNPFPSEDRGRKLAREHPNDISVIERKHRMSIRFQAGPAMGASGYTPMGGASVSGFGRVMYTETER